MSLRDSPVVLIFLDTASIARARRLFEDVIGLPIIENQFHPPHSHHGLFKYDAGNVILALNLARVPDGRSGTKEAVRTVFSVRDARLRLRDAIDAGLGRAAGGSTLIDHDGHCHAFVDAPPEQPAPGIERIVFLDEDVARMRDLLEHGLALTFVSDGGTEFRAGRIRMSIERPAHAAPLPFRHDGYLTVFHTPDIHRTAAMLPARGVPLAGEVRFTSIGGTVRFADHLGRQYCLYEPDPRCFDWGSGAKLADLVGRPQTIAAPA